MPRTQSGSRPILVTAMILVIGFVVALFLFRQLEIVRRKQQLVDLRAQKESAIDVQQELRGRLDESEDPEAIEYEARRRFGWILPGEVKVVFREVP